MDKKTGKVVANQVVQDVTFNRTAIVDNVTGELLGYDTNGDGEVDVSVADGDQAWTTDNNEWASVTSPD
ncbi:mucin-binding protein, partial [Lactiplantibacillus mudanjiangensis]|uniref:mucin-binding protein n=1 Tax=Lactiplantibacillus mudanjiangensis TaxID=1296538 RepID=UPI0027959F8B